MMFVSRLLALACLCLGCTCAWSQASADTAPRVDAVPKVEAVPKIEAAPKIDAMSKYLLSTGDVISITVYGEDDLKRERIRLTDAGTISYPVLGEIQVRGKTVGELEKLLTDGLRGSYLVNPRVAVTIDEYRPYFINGQVGNNGSFPYQPGLTVRKAVSVAGGFKERASMSKIFIVRDGDASNTPVRVDLNAPVHPGDIITVGESFF